MAKNREMPGTKEAGNIGFALLDELIRTFVSKGIIHEDEVRSMLIAAADRLHASGKAEAKIAASEIRTRMLAK